VADAAIPQVTTVLEFQGIVHPHNPHASMDYAGVVFVDEAILTTIDVQSGQLDDRAFEMAIDVATQQNDCLRAAASFRCLRFPAR
jgi:hypothetical protein